MEKSAPIYEEIIMNGWYVRIPCKENEILAHMPPAARELWLYILRKVAPYDTEFLKMGTGEFVLKEVREDLRWSVGKRKEYYSKGQIIRAFAMLKDVGIIDFKLVNEKGIVQGDSQNKAQGFVNDYMKGKHYRFVSFLNYELYKWEKS